LEHNKEELICLWESNFGDKREYIEHFFAAYKDRMRIKTICVDSQVVCSCYLLPAFICTGNGTEKKVWYLYALSTREGEKGKGYAGRLLRQIEEDYFLVPSTGLEDFYTKRGLQKWLTQTTTEIDAVACDGVDFSIVNGQEFIKEYETRRNQILCSSGYIRWDYEALEYALKEHELCGGKILKCTHDGEDVFAMISMGENGEVIIKEITTVPSDWAKYAAMAAGFLKASKAVIPEKKVMVSDKMDVIEGQGYFGLTLG